MSFPRSHRANNRIVRRLDRLGGVLGYTSVLNSLFRLLNGEQETIVDSLPSVLHILLAEVVGGRLRVAVRGMRLVESRRSVSWKQNNAQRMQARTLTDCSSDENILLLL